MLPPADKPPSVARIKEDKVTAPILRRQSFVFPGGALTSRAGGELESPQTAYNREAAVRVPGTIRLPARLVSSSREVR
jgi:hypothetical protein